MKLMFITDKPYGLIATPGTYLLLEAYADYCETKAFTTAKVNENHTLVYDIPESLDISTIAYANHLQKIKLEILTFQPDIVCLPNSGIWMNLSKMIKETFSDIKVSFEVKSPVVFEGEELSEKQKEFSNYSQYLDVVIAPSKDMVDTWFPENELEILEHPSVINYSAIDKKSFSDEIIKCRKFVFIGSLSPLRQMSTLIEFISKLPKNILDQVSFDFYGSGKDEQRLCSQTDALGLKDTIAFKGAVSQEEVFKVLKNYDCGLGWVPSEIFESAPSLKVIEYCASGLAVLATDTIGHRKTEADGFSINFFENSFESFERNIIDLIENGCPSAKLQDNIETAKNNDCHTVVKKYILPKYVSIVSQKEDFKGDVENERKILNRRYEALVEDAHWIPAVRPLEPEDEKINQEKVGAILSERLAEGLAYDCQLHLLEESNWKEQLDTLELEIIIIESVYFSCINDWRFSMVNKSSDTLKELLEYAKSKGIKSVFWFTLDVSDIENFKETAELFEELFYADRRAVNAFNNKQVHYLPPAIQPKMFNPLAVDRHEKDDINPISFGGLSEVENSDVLSELFKELPRKSTNIFENNNIPSISNVKRIHFNYEEIDFNYEEINSDYERINIQGKLSYNMLPEVLKRSEIYITHTQSRKSSMEMVWESMEAAACRSLVVNYGEIPDSDIRKDFVKSYEDKTEFKEYVMSGHKNKLSLEKEKQKAFREVYEKHTYKQRLGSIFKACSLHYEGYGLPKVSMICPTMRREYLEQVIKTYDAQVYNNKELIVVYNGQLEDIREIKKAYASRDDITFLFLPKEHYAASLLNYGLECATGEYFMRMDDDDHYGPHYASDMMLYVRAYDADIFGKLAGFVHLENSEDVYLRKDAWYNENISVFPGSEIGYGLNGFSGATFAGKTDFVKKVQFPDMNISTADSSLLEKIRVDYPDTKCMKIDILNFIIERAEDVSKHTWRIKTDSLLDSVISNDCANVYV